MKKLTSHQKCILARLWDSDTARIRYAGAFHLYELVDGVEKMTIKPITFRALVPYLELAEQVGLTEYYQVKRAEMGWTNCTSGRSILLRKC